MVKSGIYIIKNVVTNDFYIGSSINMRSRIGEHKRNLMRNKHANIKLQRSYNKYGQHSFSFEYFFTVLNRKYLLEYEQYFFDNLNPTFNIVKNAAAPWLGVRQSGSTKSKISQKLVGRKKAPFTEEHRRNLSLAHRGKPAWNKGQNWSEETLVKINMSRKKHRIYCTNGQVYESLSAAARSLGLRRGNIHHVLKGRYSQTGGYGFSYGND